MYGLLCEAIHTSDSADECFACVNTGLDRMFIRTVNIAVDKRFNAGGTRYFEQRTLMQLLFPLHCQ